MSAPITSPSSLRRLRRSRARLRSLLRLTGALDVPASSANIRHARAHHQGAFARRHLVGSPNAKRPPPTMLSSQRGPTEDEDGRWTTRPDAIAPSGSLSRRNSSSYHTRSRADFSYTWRGRCYLHHHSRPPRLPEQGHRSKDHLHNLNYLRSKGYHRSNLHPCRKARWRQLRPR